jgi:hypothetical protein
VIGVRIPRRTPALLVSAAPLSNTRRLRNIASLLLFSVLLVLNGAGASYYLAPAAARLRHPLRPLFKPSGTIGQSLGILALALFLFLWLYPLRKKIRALAFTGGIARWLDVHIAAGLFVPFVAAMHAGWRFTGLIGLGYASMLIVAISGVIGRYLYTRIPRGRSGLELTREETAAERRQLIGEISAASGLAPAEIEDALAPVAARRVPGMAGTVRQMIEDDLSRRRAVGRLMRRLEQAPGQGHCDRRTLRHLARLARREMGLTQQMQMLDGIQRVFRFWHIAHRPMAIMALIAVVVHVGVAIAVGQTWFW